MELNVRLSTSPSTINTHFAASTAAPPSGAPGVSSAQLAAMARIAGTATSASSPATSTRAALDEATLARHAGTDPSIRGLLTRISAGMTLATATPVSGGSVAMPPGTGVPTIAGATARPAGPTLVASAVADVMRQEGAASASSSGDYAFLDDPSMSTHDKVMMFIGKQLSSIEGEMQRIMRQKAGGSGGAQGASGAPGAGGGIGDAIGSVLSTIATGAATAMLGPIGGLVVGAASSAIGAISGAISGNAGTAGGTAAGGTAGRAAGGNAPSEGDTNMQLQSLVNRQQQMMTMASNVLSSLHQTAMTPLNNLRG